MTIPYSSAIPNPPNDPADDVAIMQINAGSISTIIAVDHVGFNLGGGGQHNQVTFNANNVPAIFPVTPPVLFTDLPSNHGGGPTYSQLFFYSNSIPRSSDQYVLTGNSGAPAKGSVLTFGGIIIKWGTYTLAPGVPSTPVTFANAFPNNVFSLTFGSTVSGSPNDLPVYSALTTAGFTGGRVNTSTPLGGTYVYNYIAIGN